MAPHSREKKKKPVNIRSITKNKACTFKVKGTYKDDINWMKGVGTPGKIKIVNNRIYFQGDHECCWAWGSGYLSHASHLRAGKKVLMFSMQDLVDNVCAPDLFDNGHVPAGLQWIKLEGAMPNKTYVEAYGKYTGEGKIRPRPNGERYHIADWYPLKDDEDTILAALKETVLCVSVPCFSAFLELKGNGLLDLSEAQIQHDPVVAKYHGGKQPIGHSVLLVAAGTFTPDSPELKHLTMRYWVIKNQWKRVWGYNGLGYLLRHSSLLKIHASQEASKCISERFRTNLLPYYATVTGAKLAIDDYKSPVLSGGFSVDDLVNWITCKSHLKRLLIYLFYDPTYCKAQNVDAVELFTAVGKTYHAETTVDLVLSNLDEHNTALERFRLAENDKLVLLVYLPQKPRRPPRRHVLRKLSSANRYVGNFNFGAILHWLGNDLNAGPPPS